MIQRVFPPRLVNKRYLDRFPFQRHPKRLRLRTLARNTNPRRPRRRDEFLPGSDSGSLGPFHLRLSILNKASGFSLGRNLNRNRLIRPRPFVRGGANGCIRYGFGFGFNYHPGLGLWLPRRRFLFLCVRSERDNHTRSLFVPINLVCAQSDMFGGNGARGAGHRRQVDEQVGEPHWDEKTICPFPKRVVGGGVVIVVVVVKE
ncbi:hypothetical protein B0T16DRAFT_404697 [Cercophora newfieldiana]|uniref:Uncharacterized protein n=1 Tax=Cercophora newfieldiana TaxID=92897 RepID=A0AA39YH32_9PEZI|nr:hypothetical protein B0T16DRAFT_404697 [Cercophora newfieldiana]